MICPDCQTEINDNSSICENCGFDIKLYKETYNRIYNRKLKQIQNESNNSSVSDSTNNAVHKPRCPYCNSESLTKITSLERAVNVAMFGLLGNKRKYQWYCNNCKTYW